MLDFDTARRLADAALAEGGRRRYAPLTVAVLEACGIVAARSVELDPDPARPAIP
jgi:uncharacterized protein GlcG (DUF336 family)